MSKKFTQTPQFKRGMAVEEFLDMFFRRRSWDIQPTTKHQEQSLCLGDRIYHKREFKFHIEYKSGLQTFKTGNVFLETVSVDTNNKPGWLYTCEADYIFYATLKNYRILVFKPEQLRQKVDELKAKYREVKTSKKQNNGYNTWGLIVPLDDAKKLCFSLIVVSDMWRDDIEQLWDRD